MEAKLGESTTGLVFTLPDFGNRREITICVADSKGAPVASARILDAKNLDGIRRAALTDELDATDASGCATGTGFARLEYAVWASHRTYSGAGARESAPVIVKPGDTPARVTLTLKELTQ